LSAYFANDRLNSIPLAQNIGWYRCFYFLADTTDFKQVSFKKKKKKKKKKIKKKKKKKMEVQATGLIFVCPPCHYIDCYASFTWIAITIAGGYGFRLTRLKPQQGIEGKVQEAFGQSY